ncbi:MAG: hypothetical protein ABI723_15785 [Bacteroidia bacterium]
MKRNSYILICLLMMFANSVFAQSVGINNPVPNATSALDITSTTKGLLIPRMTTAQRIAISTPATGLLVYDTTLNLFYYFDGTAWRPFMIGNLDWLLKGNAGTVPATNFIGTTDAQPIVFRTNNVEAMRIYSGGGLGIGTTVSTSSALVEMLSTSKGFLLPRMTTVQRNAIVTPATGLIVYDTSLNLFYYFDGVIWRPLVNTSGWDLPGNTGTNPLTQFVGTIDAQPLVFRTNNTEVMRLTTIGNVGIGTTAPAASAALELTSTSRGILIPRMTSAQRIAIATPATGLLVYDNSFKLFYYFDGIQWVPLQSNLGWLLTGNLGTSPAVNYLGTTDAQHFVIKTNSIEAIRVLSTNQNVGIGQALPASKFAVNGNVSIGAVYSAMAAPVNGAIIQGHTSVGSSGPLAIDVLSSYATGSEVAVAGYATGTNFAGYFQNTGTGTVGRFYKSLGAGGSVIQAYMNSTANNANVVDIASNGTGNSLNISDSNTIAKSININKISATTTASAIEIANAGKGIGVYVKNTNATNANPGIKVEQTKGDGAYIQMQAGNTGNGLYVYQNGTGLGQRLDMAATNPSIGFQINHAGTERAIDINLTNAANAADGIKIIHSGTGKGINVSVASAASYAIWATNAGTVPAVNPSYVVGAYTSNFAPGVAIIAAGGGHGIIGNSVLDALSTTDHDGGIFIVRQNNLTSTNVAAASVGAVINGTTYKVIGLGAVSTLVKDLNNDMRIMACPESPEVLFQDFGRGKLVNGLAHITLDPIFSKNIKVDVTHPLNAFIQLRGNCNGVYVTNETQTGFDVIELNGGTTNIEFTYFVSATRANETLGNQVSEYENMRFKRIDNPMFNQKER